MAHDDLADIDLAAPPFDRLRSVQRLAADRSGHKSEHTRHRLYIGHDKRSRANVLVKVTSKPGLVYEKNLNNEVASLLTINRELPKSRYFPLVLDHGRLPDGRVFLVSSLFDELPLATIIGTERIPARMVSHLRTVIATATALAELHTLDIIHVDLNPMNILRREVSGKPVIRIVDFESSYERARYAAGEFYDPPTTPGYSAPEVPARAPGPSADVYSLGAVLYTMLAGFSWTWDGVVGACVKADTELDDDLKATLLRAVHTNPDKRHSTMLEFRDALVNYLERIWPGRAW